MSDTGVLIPAEKLGDFQERRRLWEQWDSSMQLASQLESAGARVPGVPAPALVDPFTISAEPPAELEEAHRQLSAQLDQIAAVEHQIAEANQTIQSIKQTGLIIYTIGAGVALVLVIFLLHAVGLWR